MHAHSRAAALRRIESLALGAAHGLEARAIRARIADSVHMVVQVERWPDLDSGGLRQGVEEIDEVTGLSADDGVVEVKPVWRRSRTETGLQCWPVGDLAIAGKEWPGFSEWRASRPRASPWMEGAG